MVQMVFVHGVATRSGPAYDQEERNRDALFKQVLFQGAPLNIRSPRWGDLVPAMSNGGGSFAGAAGVSAYSALGALTVSDPEGGAIAELATADPATALDAVYATLVDRADLSNEDLTADDIRAFRAVTKAIAAGGQPQVAASATDEELIFNIGQFGDNAGYGAIGDKIKGAVSALADRARNSVSTSISNAFRDDLNPLVGRFLGDIFVYLKGPPQDGVRTAIRARVGKEIVAAHTAAKASGEKLVLLGHSLGGVILYDMLSSPAQAGLPADLSVDLLMTVGSQPGFFEELGLFDFKRSAGATSTPGPANVKAWHNIFDPIDLFGFRATPMFANAQDFQFDSVTGLISAHTTYFKRPQFYARARKRLQDLHVI
ncbi:hypothetical protein QO010_000586 [Caulobacter ginsengisoli]|uniref:Fungal lipase-like domain-containing protein n=1 Tax=Caulobacter ginsengisoli TaxID=400775 RepID=A0ABU0INT7_9CAUL|nr:hypothetical protein [Caulobacter ginsengisoli]MDQ0462838.1 hypothetical protein [Caulobacter ginsengisoli]